MLRRFAGVDVGGRRKGFHVAVLDARVVELFAARDSGDAVRWLGERRPAVVAVDSPYAAAPTGQRSRGDERRLARDVCGLRYTPDAETLRRRNDGYYGWILNGFRLYELLRSSARRFGWEVVECFPTASWTRWAGPRAGRPRSAWTGEALAALGLAGVPDRTNQDQRDAIAAAVTAQLHAEGLTQRFGEIVVPASGPLA